MKHLLLILITTFLISPITTFAAVSGPDYEGGGSSGTVAQSGVCGACDGTCGAELKCVGDKISNDGKKEGYCQYVDANKVALCNPLKSGTVGDFIKRLSDFVFNVALVLTPVLILYAGFLFLTSAGDPKQVSAAKNIILWTVIGLGVILLSKGIVAIMKGLLGI